MTGDTSTGLVPLASQPWLATNASKSPPIKRAANIALGWGLKYRRISTVDSSGFAGIQYSTGGASGSPNLVTRNRARAYY